MSECTYDICADRIEAMIRNAGAVSHAGLVLKSHCIAVAAEARRAALEEAAAHLDWRQQMTRVAGEKCKDVGSDDDAVRYAHYSQAHEAAAAAIRELKDK